MPPAGDFNPVSVAFKSTTTGLPIKSDVWLPAAYDSRAQYLRALRNNARTEQHTSRGAGFCDGARITYIVYTGSVTPIFFWGGGGAAVRSDLYVKNTVIR